MVSERVCITWPKGVSDEYFTWPFTDFESNLLKTLNINPFKLRLNGQGFIKAFELVYDMVDITPTLGLFFSFFELKGEKKGGWVSLSGILGKSFLQAYTTNYKGFKDNFFLVKSGERCP